MLRPQTFIAMTISLLPVMVSCKAATGGIDPQPSMALFDSFNYVGSDDFYNKNPLPDKSSFYNPILPGWYSDPTICTNGEGDYFIATSTFTFFPGVPLFHSRDLVNWKQVGHILSRPSQLRNLEQQHVSGGIFAPDIAYNPANKTYYMITTNVGDGNFFVKTQDPFGEWSDPIMLPEVMGIDPAFFFDDNGKAYIVNNDDAPEGKPEYPGHRTVRVVEFDTATDKCVGERKIVVNKGSRPEEKPIWCEGPHIYKVNDEYYLMTAEGGTSTWHSEVIYRGDSPFGPFTPYKNNPILTQRTLDPNRTDPITCAGHADLVKTPEGEWWGVFLAVRPVAKDQENLGRETFMMPVKWTDDGWPYFMQEEETVPLILNRPGVEREENVMFGNYTRTDEFDNSTLGMEWMTLRGPAENYYTLSDNPGYLTIKCGNVKSSDKAELPYVCRRINHHNFDVTTRLTFIPEHDNQSSGLMLLKDETHQYYLAKSKKGEEHFVELRKVSDSGIDVISSRKIDPNTSTIDLKVSGRGLKFGFNYSIDEGSTWQSIADNVDAGFTSTNQAGGFTGTVVGLYASDVE